PHALVLGIVDAAFDPGREATPAKSLDFDAVLAETLPRHVAQHQRATDGVAEVAAGGHADDLAVGDHRLPAIDLERILQRKTFKPASQSSLPLGEQRVLALEIALLPR